MKHVFTLAVGLFGATLFLQAQGDHPTSPSVKLIGAEQVINCTSAPVTIGVKVMAWAPGFTYLWNTGSTDSLISVKPQATRDYQVTVSNSSIGYLSMHTIQVKVFNAPVSAEDETIEVDKFTCPGKEITLAIDPVGGYAPYDFTWSNGAHQPHPIVSPLNNTSYQVTVTDRCGSVAKANVRVVFEAHDPLSEIAVQTEDFACDQAVVQLRPNLAKMSGGVGHGYMFTFSDWRHADEPIEVNGADGNKYHYIVTDACGTQEVLGWIELAQHAPELIEAEALTICKGEEAQLTESEDPFFYWDGQTMHTSYAVKLEESATFDLVYVDECGNQQETSRKITVEAVNSTFDLVTHTIDRTVQVYATELEQDNQIQWYLNGIKKSTAPNPEFELTEAGEHLITLEVENASGCTATTTRSVILQDGVSLPTAFSPNGDGRNDRFSVRIDDELERFHIKIFDRWGQLIYESSDQYFEWDGKVGGMVSPMACYAYVLNAQTTTGRSIEKRGTVSTLIID
jgi:gliding motility-associated-like protein